MGFGDIVCRDLPCIWDDQANILNFLVFFFFLPGSLFTFDRSIHCLDIRIRNLVLQESVKSRSGATDALDSCRGR